MTGKSTHSLLQTTVKSALHTNSTNCVCARQDRPGVSDLIQKRFTTTPVVYEVGRLHAEMRKATVDNHGVRLTEYPVLHALQNAPVLSSEVWELLHSEEDAGPWLDIADELEPTVGDQAHQYD